MLVKAKAQFEKLFFVIWLEENHAEKTFSQEEMDEMRMCNEYLTAFKYYFIGIETGLEACGRIL